MILGLIPARGGSKGIPRKNLADLGGAPLLAHTIASGMNARGLDHVAVSTEDPAIERAARRLGVDVIRRPKALAGDRAPMLGAVRHAVEDVERRLGRRVDAVTLLQPTSPFRRSAHIDAAVALFRKAGAESVVSVHRAGEHPCECVRSTSSGLRPAVKPPRGPGRQAFPAFYYVNGAIYVTSRRMLLARGRFWDRSAKLYEMPPRHGVDIDEPHQLETARAMLAADPALSELRRTQ